MPVVATEAQLRMQVKPEEATWFHCFQRADGIAAQCVGVRESEAAKESLPRRCHASSGGVQAWVRGLFHLMPMEPAAN